MFKQKTIVLFLQMAIIMVITACSSQKNTAKSRWWQSFTAKYNTYYNGTLAYIDGSLEKEKGNKDNYTEIIPLYTVGNKSSQSLNMFSNITIVLAFSFCTTHRSTHSLTQNLAKSHRNKIWPSASHTNDDLTTRIDGTTNKLR